MFYVIDMNNDWLSAFKSRAERDQCVWNGDTTPTLEGTPVIYITTEQLLSRGWSKAQIAYARKNQEWRRSNGEPF